MTQLMSEAEAAWVRANAWTKGMRKIHKDLPGYYTHCACQWTMPDPCRPDRALTHQNCKLTTPLRHYETTIGNLGNKFPARFAEPYEHPTDTSFMPPRRTSYAHVWLADRVCCWKCECHCHTQPTIAPLARQTATTTKIASDDHGQLDLFALLGADDDH